MVQKGKEQYEKMYEETSEKLVITENKLQFYVNLHDYLDTGLFFDYRRLRADFLKTLKSKKFLNLYAYTGAFSVVAAKTGAHVTTVDLSNTYLNWAKDNFRINHLMFNQHEFIHKDTFTYLKETADSFDTIFCDPPSFSNSKSFDGSFDVQRDHAGLIKLCMTKLQKGGSLYFSNNFKKFKIDEELKKEFNVQDITNKTIPKDFDGKKPHHCFLIKHQEA
jgi:23S rRNA G2069 N7-methylase RlmK/C1962 C5-methylase RlmI